MWHAKPRVNHHVKTSERKMKTWRLLKHEVQDAYTNMAIDEAITIARINSSVPNTLRLYRWKPSAVSVGRFQDVFNEVQVENCRLHNVDIVRRITGGGTVYHDSDGEITYSVIAREKDFGTTDVVHAYNTICNGLIDAAKTLGVNADFNPGDPRNCPNIAIDQKKVSGSAQFHKDGVLLQHGTFLLDVNLKKMFTFLRVPWSKTKEDVVCVAENRITSVSKELKRHISVDEAYQALIHGFQRALKTELREDNLTSQELQLASRLKQDKFSHESWNLQAKI